jgi:hypothetical protein
MGIVFHPFYQPVGAAWHFGQVAGLRTADGKERRLGRGKKTRQQQQNR